MTLVDTIRDAIGMTSFETSREDADRSNGKNVGDAERIASIAAGAVAVLAGLSRRSVPGLVCAAVGGALVYRGATGHCPAYSLLGVDTAEPKSAAEQQEELDAKGIRITQAFLINRPAQQLYDFWRDFERLPRVMTHLKSVTVLDEKRSHWVATAPRIAGSSAEWDAEIVRDEPGSVIAWRSLPGSEIENSGEVRFSPGMGDRGTEVHVTLQYLPPGGAAGHFVAKLFGSNPRRQIREDLRNFKRLMELGEVPTIDGQPRGTCTGEGTRESYSP